MSDQGMMPPLGMMGAMQAPMALQGAPIEPPAPPMLHKVTLLRRKTYGCAKVEPVPPEEFGITRRARSVHVMDADYAFHEVRRTHASLLADGYDEALVDSLPTAGPADTTEDVARDTVSDSQDEATASMNRSTRLIRITEHYATLDYEGDGKPCLYKIITGGGDNKILTKKGEPDLEKVEMMPFAAMTPVIMTHRFFGRSVADLVMDIMRIKTALLRSGLDNIYLANNQRIEIAETHAADQTLDDLLTNRPGGIVRTKQPGGLTPIPNQDITAAIFPALEYMDAQREWRTGVTRQGQGLDAKSLADQSATAAAQLFTMAQARMRLIARIFAETGVRDLFTLLHGTIRKHGQEAGTIRLRNKWVTVDPRNWKTRNDMTVNVGIAAGSKGQELMFLMNLLGIQKEAMMAPQTGLATSDNVYNTLKRVVKVGGLKGIEPYFTDPSGTDDQGQPNRKEAPPDPKMLEMQAKGEIEKVKAQAKVEADQMKAQVQAEATQRIKAIELEAEQRQKALDAQAQAFKEKVQAEADIVVERERTRSEERLAAQQRAYDAVQAQLDRQHQINLELIKQRGQAERQARQEQAASVSQDKQLASDRERDEMKAKQQPKGKPSA